MRLFAFAFACLLGACSIETGHGLVPASSASHEAASSFTRVHVLSFELRAPAELPLGQTMTLSVAGRDAFGRVAAGAYDRPIFLRAFGMTLSKTRIDSARDGAEITASWSPDAIGADGKIVAEYGGRSIEARVHATSGFRYYDVGHDPSTDVTGFQIVQAPNGRLFYGTLGPQTCSGNICSSAQGAIGELDPNTGRAHQIALPSEVLGLLVSSDGALWIAGGSAHLLYRMNPGPLSTPAAIVAPTPSASVTWGPRLFAQDGSGNVWFGDAGGGRVLHIPLAGPYQESSIVASSLPAGPAGTPHANAYANGIAYGSDGNLYVADYTNGVVDLVSPSTGATAQQLVLPQQVAIGGKGSAKPRFAASSASAVFVSLFGDSLTATGRGAIDASTGGVFSSVKLPRIPAGSIPDSISIAGSGLYYADIFTSAVGYVDLTTGRSRAIPVKSLGSKAPYTPNGIAAASDGTAWFTCKDNTVPLQPLCIGHTVYLANWSLFPGPSFNVAKGTSLSQVVGIMEAPSRDSGPFTAHSSDSKVCAASKVVDHDFVVTGKRFGKCTITVTDAKHVHRSVNVQVVP